MEICELKDIDEKAWDEYVLKHPDSTFYHQIGWKNVVEKSYGHKPYYLMAKEDGEIKGVLPLFFMKSMLFGKKLVSVPFAPYGGVIGDNCIFEEMLIERAVEITKGVDADYLEFRNAIFRESKYISNTNYMTLVLKLDDDSEVIWKRFNNKVRNAIRKSLSSKLELKTGNVDDFYRLYSKNMRNLGTPTHSNDFFSAVMSMFPDKTEIITVSHMDEPVSVAILLYFKDTVISGWAASDRKHRNLKPNNLLYWSAIKNACDKGYIFFDFGRSIEDSGTYQFKKPWGAEKKQLQYMYYLNRIKQLPDTSQANSKRKKIAKVWKLLPLPVTNALGAKFRRDLP